MQSLHAALMTATVLSTVIDYTHSTSSAYQNCVNDCNVISINPACLVVCSTTIQCTGALVCCNSFNPATSWEPCMQHCHSMFDCNNVTCGVGQACQGYGRHQCGQTYTCVAAPTPPPVATAAPTHSAASTSAAPTSAAPTSAAPTSAAPTAHTTATPIHPIPTNTTTTVHPPTAPTPSPGPQPTCPTPRPSQTPRPTSAAPTTTTAPVTVSPAVPAGGGTHATTQQLEPVVIVLAVLLMMVSGTLVWREWHHRRRRHQQGHGYSTMADTTINPLSEAEDVALASWNGEDLHNNNNNNTNSDGSGVVQDGVVYESTPSPTVFG
eukprot:m.111248 g.111248  ORF g.111248 m.111248 type:complete len:322 (+) comp10745_c2_seq1:2210-3175(+)